MRLLVSTICVVFAAGCTMTGGGGSSDPAPQAVDPSKAEVSRFLAVQRRIEPVAEKTCRQRTVDANCDFRIVLDDRPSETPNAFQTVDNSGRPVLAINQALIAEARTQDELAFILGHEAAHHIQGHLVQTVQNARTGALVLGTIVRLAGASTDVVNSAYKVGATVGSRTYSKGFELEADYLGAQITMRAGYNAVQGAQFFDRIPDPGDAFLGTHPPNAQRVETVRRAVHQTVHLPVRQPVHEG